MAASRPVSSPVKKVVNAPAPVGGFPDHPHDHGPCVRDALARAESLCAARGARLTAVRRRVLEVVWHGHTPIGAYEVLARLGDGGKKVQPPTVYRALDFLLAQGLVHRIERLNAYIGCAVPGVEHSGQFLICGSCGVTAELVDPRIDDVIGQGALALGFIVEQPTVELHGLCAHCRKSHKEKQK